MNPGQNLYRLGLRLGQTHIVLSEAVQSGFRWDWGEVRHFASLSAAALTETEPILNAKSTFVTLTNIMQQINREIDFASNPNHDLTPPNLSMASSIQTIGRTICDTFEMRGTNSTLQARWFNLGLEMATVESLGNSDNAEEEPYPKQASGNTFWGWRDPHRIDELIAELRIPFDSIFPTRGISERQRRDTKNKFDFRHREGWLYLELGLSSLLEETARAGHRRKSYDRDHKFLEWYEAEADETYHSKAQIRDRWNALHSDEKVSIDTVKMGIRKAKLERKEGK